MNNTQGLAHSNLRFLAAAVLPLRPSRYAVRLQNERSLVRNPMGFGDPRKLEKLAKIGYEIIEIQLVYIKTLNYHAKIR